MVDVTSVRFLPAALAGWLNHQQAEAMAYVIDENQTLRAHWGAIAGADFFTTEMWTWRGLVTYYTLFVMDLASRRVQIVGSTPHPDDLFMRQVERARSAVFWDITRSFPGQ